MRPRIKYAGYYTLNGKTCKLSEFTSIETAERETRRLAQSVRPAYKSVEWFVCRICDGKCIILGNIDIIGNFTREYNTLVLKKKNRR